MLYLLSVILHAPTLGDTSPQKQDEIDDILCDIYRKGPDCFLYLLKTAKLFDNWGEVRKSMLEKTREFIPEPLQKLRDANLIKKGKIWGFYDKTRSQW